MSEHEEGTVTEVSEQSDEAIHSVKTEQPATDGQTAEVEQSTDDAQPPETEQSTFNEESAETGQSTADGLHTTNEQSEMAAFLSAIEHSKYTTVYEVADVDEEEYTEMPYSRLSKLDKYKVAYALWDECTPKSPSIRRILAYLGFLIFYSQLLKKKRNDKELKANLKEVEAKLADEYENLFGGMFQQGAGV